MKANSSFFARIQTDVVAIMRAVPFGSLVTFKDVGAHLDVMPRHVAYLLSMRGEGFDKSVPWHRAVPDSGKLQTPKHGDDGESQADLLRDEGILIGQGGGIMNLAAHVCDVAGLPHAVAKQKRPVDTLQSKSRK
jgi:methylated-DNA-protein-cysteine methyltransferase related protein